MSGIEQVGNDPFKAFQTAAMQKAASPAVPSAPVVPAATADSKPDSFEKNTEEVKKENTDKIGFFRLAFKRLTQKQIDTINETKQLPKKAKFRPMITGAAGGFKVQNNIFNLTNGTRTLPEGYEVRKNKLGFTRVVPKDSEGFWLKKKETPKA